MGAFNQAAQAVKHAEILPVKLDMNSSARDIKASHKVFMTLPGGCAFEPNVRPVIDYFLEPTGIDVDRFCAEFDERTLSADLYNWPTNVWVYVYEDKSFEFDFTHTQLLGAPPYFTVRDVYLEFK